MYSNLFRKNWLEGWKVSFGAQRKEGKYEPPDDNDNDGNEGRRTDGHHELGGKENSQHCALPRSFFSTTHEQNNCLPQRQPRQQHRVQPRNRHRRHRHEQCVDVVDLVRRCWTVRGIEDSAENEGDEDEEHEMDAVEVEVSGW
jgi:hypothetical protein